ncbi:hypothetical protein A3H10_01555 [Candidatus Uhrbacteria bacterium RIFCSPLOWO2_12_FULL_46_10]|uniref:Uncharacterized protein n=1 Tax=Candidatus Uhrbacteria bacterium RIFCSPLOWO2_01_FULL_47_25 TaxID=1802402 RepID=A0A1F7UTB2_9BACT|nr:MAG: hypothetical protein UX68_C0008G0028 [Parcubacteria group bacterium GW2011_GWA2_46_9]OGL60470.1 MAG: hypothetical protein A2752_05220 [Candidatus Uhrbacteria bacterium RIFCSPHIGHO2_01_FULL_46_23]OGL81543.1 MAG: hypothetical protein A2936_01740 [Candidatus Uhrbacteria bacterium RIFCSPLOWO2_01_FULL_47_25]OGL85764.1 MAG: hypothetical protein A3I37_02680 [Candidatus Uhrbacteria bacterium RIFCSPLOWO2_02_FULL_46_19]OGL91517.1 MAG: hypothetical protein A3H10_01555 [Candidatus Uhrbacteria bacte
MKIKNHSGYELLVTRVFDALAEERELMRKIRITVVSLLVLLVVLLLLMPLADVMAWLPLMMGEVAREHYGWIYWLSRGMYMFGYLGISLSYFAFCSMCHHELPHDPVTRRNSFIFARIGVALYGTGLALCFIGG